MVYNRTAKLVVLKREQTIHTIFSEKTEEFLYAIRFNSVNL